MKRRDFLTTGLAAAADAYAARGLKLSQLTSATASLVGFTLEESFREIARIGFGGVEIFADLGRKHSIGTFPGAIVDRLSSGEQKTLRRLAGRFEHVTTHIPFHDLRPVDADAAVRERSVAAIERGIRDSGWWGAQMGTLHVAPEKDYAPVWKQLLETYRRFGDVAAKHKVRLGIETGAPNTVQQFLALIREVNHEAVGATVDTGHTRGYRKDAGITDSDLGTDHARKRYNDVLMSKVEGLGPKLFHFHFDDVRASDWREHRTLGTGIVDWQRLLGYLKKTGYVGAFAIELEETPPAGMLVQSREFYAKCLQQSI